MYFHKTQAAIFPLKNTIAVLVSLPVAVVETAADSLVTGQQEILSAMCFLYSK